MLRCLAILDTDTHANLCLSSRFGRGMRQQISCICAHLIFNVSACSNVCVLYAVLTPAPTIPRPLQCINSDFKSAMDTAGKAPDVDVNRQRLLDVYDAKLKPDVETKVSADAW